MVFQSYALFPHLTVFENVAFGLRRRGTDKTEVARRVGAALELVHLPDFGKRKPDQLSGGQQQRVALARALVCEPTVLLLDEPLGALDLKLRRQLQVELKRVQLEVGITFIYVTHDQEEALALSDRIAVMDRGRVEQLGTPEDLYDQPATRFVAGFIGTTNLLSGTVESRVPGAVVVRLDGGERCLAGEGVAVGSAVDLAIRPEAMSLAPDDQSTENAGPVPELRGRVLQSAYLGTSVSHQVRTDGGLVLTVVVPRSVERPSPGDRVRLGWDPSDVLVLERTAESRGRRRRYDHERDRSDPPTAAPAEPPLAAPRHGGPWGRGCVRPGPGRVLKCRGVAEPDRDAGAARDTRGYDRADHGPDHGADPRTDPRSLARGRALRLQLRRVHRRGDDPVVRAEVRDQGHLRRLHQLRGDDHQDLHREQRLRHHVRDGRGRARLPGAEPRPAPGSLPRPEHRQPRDGVAEPCLRSRQRPLGAVHVVDHRLRLRHRQDRRGPDLLGRPLGSALEGQDGRCSTTTGRRSGRRSSALATA